MKTVCSGITYLDAYIYITSSTRYSLSCPGNRVPMTQTWNFQYISTRYRDQFFECIASLVVYVLRNLIRPTFCAILVIMVVQKGKYKRLVNINIPIIYDWVTKMWNTSNTYLFDTYLCTTRHNIKSCSDQNIWGWEESIDKNIFFICKL